MAGKVFDQFLAALGLFDGSGDADFLRERKSKVVCEIEVVGSTTVESWEWSWGNETLPTVCRTRMSLVFEFGEQKQWNRLTTLFLENDEYVGWECASVASHILGGIGVYKCPNSDGAKRTRSTS